MNSDWRTIDQAPYEIGDAIREFWPDTDWDAATSICWLESGWDAFAVNNTVTPATPCGTPITTKDGVVVSAERSVGFFQINTCNLPGWEWQRLYNARHNAGTAHMLWGFNGWSPWLFSARKLGLLE